MLKREQVWRHLADQTLAGTVGFHQQEIARDLAMSIGNVNLAIQPLRDTGAVEIVAKKVIVRDIRKLLTIWAARHNPEPVIAAFASAADTRGTMRLLPAGLALTSFAGVLAAYPDRPDPAPAPHVRAYIDPADSITLAELRKRFTERPDGPTATVKIHAADPVLAAKLPPIVSPAQMYVDLWHEGDFYAGDYLRALEAELRL